MIKGPIHLDHLHHLAFLPTTFIEGLTFMTEEPNGSKVVPGSTLDKKNHCKLLPFEITPGSTIPDESERKINVKSKVSCFARSKFLQSPKLETKWNFIVFCQNQASKKILRSKGWRHKLWNSSRMSIDAFGAPLSYNYFTSSDFHASLCIAQMFDFDAKLHQFRWQPINSWSQDHCWLTFISFT